MQSAAKATAKTAFGHFVIAALAANAVPTNCVMKAAQWYPVERAT
jgi:hypothetical protein